MKKITAALSAALFAALCSVQCGAEGLTVTGVSAGMLVENTGSEACKGAAIAAEYDENGLLIGAKTQTLELAAGEKDYFSYPDGICKAYVFDGTGFIRVKAEQGEEDIMLIDYYRATVATVGGDGYDEYVLYRYSDTEAKLSVFSKHYGDEEESRTDYIVPYEAVKKCYELIEEKQFRGWKDRKDTYGITGAFVAVKFREDDGSYVRVSSESMPDGGREDMDAVGGLLAEYMKEEYKFKEDIK